MDGMLGYIALYANGVILVGIKYYAFICLFKPAVRKRWLLLAYVAFLILTTQLFFEFGSMWANLIVNVSTYLALTFLFSGNIGTKLVFAVLIYVMGVLADGLSFLILQVIYGAGATAEPLMPIGRTMSNIIFLPLVLVNILIFRRYINKNARYRHFKIPTKYTAAILLLLFGIILINVLFVSATIDEVYTRANQLAVSHLISTAIILLIIWIYHTILNHLEEFEKSRQKDQMLKRWELQYQTAVNSQKVIAELKHNLKFHFLALSSFLEKGEIVQAKNHIETEVGDFDFVITTGNISIDTMLNYYQQRARDRLGIDLETELLIPSDLTLDANLTVMILGNALENALDACSNIEQEQRYIRIRAEITTKDEFLLTITNPYIVTPVTDRDGSLITTKPDKRRHGFGLVSIQETLSEDDGHIHLQYADGTFQFMLLFYNVFQEKEHFVPNV